MSKGYNKNGLFIDVGLLRDHISKLNKEKKLAQRLYENVVAMRDCSDSYTYDQLTVIIRESEKLIEYFSRMARVLEETESETVRLSHNIGAKIAENIEEVKYTSSQSIML